jgi:transcriptional regulator with XRE-family HTH domain
MPREGFASWLRKAMKARQIRTPSDLAKRSGVDQSLISRWLRDGTQPALPALRRVALVLDVPLLDLMVVAGHIEPTEANREDVPEPPAPVPVGANVDPDLIAQLAESSPEALEAVRALLRATKQQ